jgi:hypothetical protein
MNLIGLIIYYIYVIYRKEFIMEHRNMIKIIKFTILAILVSLFISSCHQKERKLSTYGEVTGTDWLENALNPSIVAKEPLLEEPPAHSGSFELWNGFFAEMNKEQVIEKTKQSLLVTQTPLDSSNNWRVDFSLTELPDTGPIQFTQGSSMDKIINNRSFIILGSNTERVSFISTTEVKELGYQCVKIASPIPSYLQDKYGTGGIVENIFFYFYQDKLFAIIIRWSGDIETGKLLVERYGDCTAIMNSISGGEIYQTWAVWKLSDRLIYSYITKGTRQRTTCYISRYYVERAIEDIDIWETTHKTNKEIKRQAAIEGAVF